MKLHASPPVGSSLKIMAALTLLWLPALQACHTAHPPRPALAPVPALDLNRYMGTWYEIFAMPNPYQKNCFATQAQYTLTDRGEVVVRNSCHKGALTGPLKEVVGKAWCPDAARPAALKVQFFWPFSGDYWVLDVDPDYQWAVVGQPKRKYLWILARTPTLSEAITTRLMARLPEFGYDPAALRKTAQPEVTSGTSAP